jgi:hypothetical protein
MKTSECLSCDTWVVRLTSLLMALHNVLW